MNAFQIDHGRIDRVGFPEIIYGASKTTPVIVQILHEYQNRNANALVTKVQPEKGRDLLEHFPEAHFDELSATFLLEYDEEKLIKGEIAVIAAGTSDLFIANEVYYTLAYLGLQADRVIDIGVAGLHRLLEKLEQLQQFKVLVVVAGFEGALPTVIGGLLPQPIIAVPASVGYGVAGGGQAALSSMLASCANGISVMNIDNGCGAALAAFRILRQISKG